jgi:hypothetical protein
VSFLRVNGGLTQTNRWRVWGTDIVCWVLGGTDARLTTPWAGTGGSGPAAAGPGHLGTQQDGLAGISPWLPRCCRLQSLASWLLALASRSEPRLRVRWGKRTGEPSAAGAHGGGPRQWVPGSAQSSEGPRGQYRGPGPDRNRQGRPAQPGPSESSQRGRRGPGESPGRILAGDLPR